MLIELFELASNNALQHGPKTQQQLLKLQGKTMVLHIKSIEQSIAVTPCPEGVEFSREIPNSVDVTLTATINAMLKISRDGFEDAELNAGELEIVGDPIVGQRFAKIIAELDIDWNGLLAEHIGESPAHLIGMAAGHAKDFAQQSTLLIKSRLNTLIVDELEVAANQSEIDDFLDDIDTLRADSERLALRIKRLQTKA